MRKDNNTRNPNYEVKSVEGRISVKIPKTMVKSMLEKEMGKMMSRISYLEDRVLELENRADWLISGRSLNGEAGK